MRANGYRRRRENQQRSTTTRCLKSGALLQPAFTTFVVAARSAGCRIIDQERRVCPINRLKHVIDRRVHHRHAARRVAGIAFRRRRPDGVNQGAVPVRNEVRPGGCRQGQRNTNQQQQAVVHHQHASGMVMGLAIARAGPRPLSRRVKQTMRQRIAMFAISITWRPETNPRCDGCKILRHPAPPWRCGWPSRASGSAGSFAFGTGAHESSPRGLSKLDAIGRTKTYRCGTAVCQVLRASQTRIADEQRRRAHAPVADWLVK